jgi:DNA end-binding protein Ku
LDEIDPIFFRTSYYLAPQGEQARRAYALLRAAMEDSRKIGIATFVLRGKQYLVAVRPESEVIGLETMFFSDEVRDPANEIDGIPVESEIKDRELETAKLLIDSMTSEWEPSNYQDTYRKAVENLIDQKRQGAVVTIDAREPALPPVVDLMEALRASVAAAGGRKGAKEPAAKAANAKSQKRATGAAASSGTADLTLAELKAKATELGVQGRSKMTRKELEDAVAGTQRSRRAS